ncbi:MAG TPA: hypothetical protein VHS03_10595, partial [Gaiellaceae bacterium]|nr:hypothetical protein [Gaiellaceae bacterium]
MARSKRVPPPAPSARDLVEQCLEPGEPIEVVLRVASTGPAANVDVANAVGIANVATLGTAAVAVSGLQRTIAIALTDRRVFFVRDATRAGVRIEERSAVRVLEYDTAGASILVWLNVDGHQLGVRIPR